MPAEQVPVVVLGSAGYVGGELLRILALHPLLGPVAAVSESKPGSVIADVFPHLAAAFGAQTFASTAEAEALLRSGQRVALFSALPHGESAGRIAQWIQLAQANGADLHVVDISADLRLGSAALHEQVYGKPHPAPQLLDTAVCALPELVAGVPSKVMAHPGCFTTAVTLACRPLHALALSDGAFFASAITGSTGSGREPTATTHHPWRHGNMRAYSPLTHRHEHEMRRLVSGKEGCAEILFVPHSGPFARGIHATIHVRLKREHSAAELRAALAAFYKNAPFVAVGAAPPALKDVVGTNRCHLAVECRGKDAVVFSVIDNLTKGASGGAVQWMNRMLGFAEDTGLKLPGLGWN